VERDLFPGSGRSAGVTLGLRALVVLVAIAAAATGCAGAGGTILLRSARDDCERSGGVWRPAIAYCEVQAGSSPI